MITQTSKEDNQDNQNFMQKIQAYWAAQGHAGVELWQEVTRAITPTCVPIAALTIRSNLRNGKPVRAKLDTAK